MELLQKAMIAMAAPATTWAIAKALEDAASKTARTTLAMWLKGSKFAEDLTSPLQAFLLNIFYEFFGRNSRTWKFARRVLICSIAAVTLFWLIGTSVLVAYIFQYEEVSAGKLWDRDFYLFLMIGFSISAGGILVSFPCDYLSVIKSLALLRLAEAEKKFQFYCVVDVAISLMMGFSWFLFTGMSVGAINKYLGNTDTSWITGLTDLYQGMLLWSVFSVLVTSLAPTLMLLVVTVTGYVARAAFRLAKPFDFLRLRVFRIDEKPFLSLGLLLAIPVYLFVLLILLAVG